MSWIEWCKCGRRILTTGQIKEKKPCALCQEEKAKRHAATLKERIDEVISKEDFNG